LAPWLTSSVLGESWSVKLFGQGAKRSWTVAILSSLKDKANEIQPGMLKWILRTAMPLQDDFECTSMARS